MDMMPLLFLTLGAGAVLAMVAFAFAGPSASRAGSRRLAVVRGRHGPGSAVAAAQARGISNNRHTRMDLAFGRILPNPAQLAKRLAMTGKSWTVGQYGFTTAGIFTLVGGTILILGMHWYFALSMGLFLGVGLPHFVVGSLIKKRVRKFTAKFPDALELLVRGLRSGLPISETIGVVGNELSGPVGVEFRHVSDKMKIGRTMDGALQDTADRLGTPEFQFFVITIAIQRETGGNLAETLANLANVLRLRGQMKLKIKAMSSESKASAYILGSLPFIVFGLIYLANSAYVMHFFTDPRLIAVGLGAIVWICLGAFIMSQMISFEI